MTKIFIGYRREDSAHPDLIDPPFAAASATISPASLLGTPLLELTS